MGRLRAFKVFLVAGTFICMSIILLKFDIFGRFSSFNLHVLKSVSQIANTTELKGLNLLKLRNVEQGNTSNGSIASNTEQHQTQVTFNEEQSTNKTKIETKAAEVEKQELCPEKGPTLVGPLLVNQTVFKMEDLEKTFSSEFGGWVNKGGTWRPTECKARVKVALIIPYRNRSEHLSMFVNHMHPMLKRQNLDYRIIVVEQLGNDPFNRGMLMNIGYKEALKFDQYACFVFHDVDLIPEDDRNEYSCPSSPMHHSVAIDKNNYRLPYSSSFGGASSFRKNHFELINGYSNIFWGWGGEDDDLYIRIQSKGLRLTRIPAQFGRYKMIRIFHKSSVQVQDKFGKLRYSVNRIGHDGLSSLKYVVKQLTEHRLYTLVTVVIDPSTTKYR